MRKDVWALWDDITLRMEVPKNCKPPRNPDPNADLATIATALAAISEAVARVDPHTTGRSTVTGASQPTN